MKKYLFVSIAALILLSFSCSHAISYEIRNNTDYDVIVYDVRTLNHTEYNIRANSIVTIDHTAAGVFDLKNNQYPITIFNNYISTEIKYLPSKSLTICNNSDKSFELKVLNTTHNSTSSFNIAANYNDSITVYANDSLDIKLFYNNNEYSNYIINDNRLLIF